MLPISNTPRFRGRRSFRCPLSERCMRRASGSPAAGNLLEWSLAGRRGADGSHAGGLRPHGPCAGLIDLARPPLAEVGTPKSNSHRRAFWYRRTFRIDGHLPAVARLKIHKACYGTAVYLNGRFVGEHLPCFTPFTARRGKATQGRWPANELVVRVGGYRDAVPRSIPDGWDVEKSATSRAFTTRWN